MAFLLYSLKPFQMKKLILFFVLFVIPFCLKAQENNAQIKAYMIKPGYLKKDIRKNCENEPANFKLISNTDTCDSYIYKDYFRINCHYKNDTCHRLELIYPFDHKQIQNGSQAPYKKIGDNLWVLYNEGLEMKLSFDTTKDLIIYNISVSEPKKID
jgi:hypothetical protein